jgi:catechol 2,3-dioxygenase-like lactoylglutathione lyase family enzyme
LSAGSAALPTFARVDQICILVEDLDDAIATYASLFAAKHWRGYRYGPDTVPELEYRGAPGVFSMWLALSDSTPQIELIQPEAGPSIYTEWIERHGFGFHHVGVVTDTLAADTKALEAQGYVVSQSGRGYGLDGDGGFAYFDSVERLGVVLELIEVPKRRRAPDREWAIA